MAYVQQAAWFCALMLLLQASICSRKRFRPALTPISAATIYKKLRYKPLSSDHALEGSQQQIIDFNPDFDDDNDNHKTFNPEVDSNGYNEIDTDSNGDSNAGYDSGYDSDKDANKNTDKDASATPKPKQLSSSVPDLKKHNVILDFEHTIQKMRKEADASRSIHCKLSADRLIRTVEDGPNDQHSLYAAEDYVIQGLNIYRAAKKICALYGQDASPFEVKAHDFLCYYSDHLEKPEAFWINKIKEINQGVVAYLYKKEFLHANVDAINNKLRIAENYVGLDDTHYNVTTTFKVAGKKFALEDKKWLTLTENQKQAYRNRQSEKWYKRLDPFEQKFIDA
ncbi:MSCRAMM family adhesin SdrC [Candidatus Cardinium sp. TP]|uniref:MSCRAMM family adhesin SdrC n=1 Tax=Candidatus Cardinium sp. TP TaxID=2961955 RepID=UPI0021AFBED0|nr:MSCRAMM family adhesin SdrC [Candidatus Cardinium sp. TP]MCT4697262.1 MSCRAMM family adhesin SdrC [Candidatus Cardinium sp. TP]